MNSNTLSVALECATKHGMHYPSSALEHIELIKPALSSAVVDNDEAECYALAEVAAKLRAKLRIAAKHYEDTALKRAKYALHLLERLMPTPWDDGNNVIDAELVFCIDALNDYAVSRSKEPEKTAEEVPELDSALRQAHSMHASLHYDVDDENVSDIANLINLHSYMLSSLLANTPVAIMSDYWEAINPDTWYGYNETLHTIHDATTEVLRDMNDETLYSDQDWIEAGLNMCACVAKFARNLSGYDAYRAPLRPSVHWVSEKLDELELHLRRFGNQSCFWVASAYCKMSDIRASLRDDVATSYMHVRMPLEAAMEMCGAYRDVESAIA
ncbi:hypothetical protein IJ847_01015 [Candidatus Saccharibacteria bacterium]|nr:hypothetical protein [Candidatus Saccharibacteria bacterium]